MSALWKLPVVDFYGNKAEIPFYITEGDGPLLLGNEVISSSNLLGEENLLVIPKGVQGISTTTLSLPTYTTSEDHSLRTRLHIVPCVTSHMKTFFSSARSFHSTLLSNDQTKHSASRYHDAKYARMFAVRLHTFTHLTTRDMKEICTRAKILTPVLAQALEAVFDKCTSCKSTGRPVHSRKVSFSRVLAAFNDHLQVDYLFIRELGNLPILHLTDVGTGFSVTVLMISRDMQDASQMISTRWFDVHGPPKHLSGDPEFNNETIHALCSTYDVLYDARPARRHNKIGSVESANAAIRLFVQRLLKDEQHYRKTRNRFQSDYEVLSHATFLKNVLYGSKKLSSFEMAKGYTPAICGLSQSQFSSELLRAHQEQVARRALHEFIHSRITATVSSDLLPPRTPVYFFFKENKVGTWRSGYVLQAEGHIVNVCTDRELKNKPLQVAYEDVRVVPSSTLLQELDAFEFGRVDEELDSSNIPQDSPQDKDASVSVPVYGDEPPEEVLVTHTDHDILPLDGEEDILSSPDILMDKESAVWAEHPHAYSMLSSGKPYGKVFNSPSMDIGSPTPKQDIAKDIGTSTIQAPDSFPTSLESTEQELLLRIKDVVGDASVTEHKLQFAPRWIIDKAINKEKKNYKDKEAYVPVSIRSVPRQSNIISSHHFFQVKTDGSTDRLKLKCRLVPHGNRDSEKDSIRSDSSTAQFVCIRFLLSLASLLHFGIASLDISGAYLQAGKLQRDIYMRPPKGWTEYIDEVWKIVKPAYGLVESGRLWQLCVEEWLQAYGFTTLPGLPQLFVLRHRKSNKLVLLVAKVVDDFLLSGTPAELDRFSIAIKKRFHVGRYIDEPKFVFNRLSIHQSPNFSISISMKEFADKIEPIDLSRARRKQPDERCTASELTALQSLAGKLNYLGHGVLPPASLAASKMQQNVGDLRVHHLQQANASLHHIKKLDPSLTYQALSSPLDVDNLSSSYLLSFSDASTGQTSTQAT